MFRCCIQELKIFTLTSLFLPTTWTTELNLSMVQVQQQVIDIVTHIAATASKFPKDVCCALPFRSETSIVWCNHYHENVLAFL